ncbi:NAD(P)H-hydrate dehydratase [Deferribacter thermophilus]|uniref:NAD(P)H-hydrate dehydratase n=1 Tax=Deferribacter thermophilus TaxID=53573 RepID=UPI003C20B187
MEVLTSKQMANADKYTIETLKTPSIVLMENAARAIFEEFEKLNIKKNKVAVLIGKGNNGGDGIAVARHLFNNGYHVDIILLYPQEELKGDAKLNLEIIKNYPIKLLNYNENINFNEYDVIFDAIFGTGLSRAVDGFIKDIIKQINLSNAYKIAIDIPSGLSGSNHNVIGECIKADLTITLARPKIPHVFYPAKKFCGKVVVKDISIPDFAIQSVSPFIFELTLENLPTIYKREEDSHKGHFGHNVIIGGSAGKMGAPIMASYASVMSGAGLTTCAIFEQYYYFLSKYPEIMAFIVKGRDFFTTDELEPLLEFIKDKEVITLGCGLGRNHQTKEFVKGLIENTDKNFVIDADGLYHLDDLMLKNLSFRAVLTPHIGEFAKLTELTKEEVLNNKIELAREFSTKYQVVLVLKSADTIIATPDANLYVLSNGTPALSKGGSGDCLAGIIGSLIAQKYSLEDAAKLGCYVMNLTAAILSKEKNEKCLRTTEIIKNIYRGFNEIENYQQL